MAPKIPEKKQKSSHIYSHMTLLSHFFAQSETAGHPSNGQSAISVYKELASSMTVSPKKGNALTLSN
jgi:hypothetical protein